MLYNCVTKSKSFRSFSVPANSLEFEWNIWTFSVTLIYPILRLFQTRLGERESSVWSLQTFCARVICSSSYGDCGLVQVEAWRSCQIVSWKWLLCCLEMASLSFFPLFLLKKKTVILLNWLLYHLTMAVLSSQNSSFSVSNFSLLCDEAAACLNQFYYFSLSPTEAFPAQLMAFFLVQLMIFMMQQGHHLDGTFMLLKIGISINHCVSCFLHFFLRLWSWHLKFSVNSTLHVLSSDWYLKKLATKFHPIGSASYSQFRCMWFSFWMFIVVVVVVIVVTWSNLAVLNYLPNFIIFLVTTENIPGHLSFKKNLKLTFPAPFTHFISIHNHATSCFFDFYRWQLILFSYIFFHPFQINVNRIFLKPICNNFMVTWQF